MTTTKEKFLSFVDCGCCGQSLCHKPALFAYKSGDAEYHQCQEHTPSHVIAQAKAEYTALLAVAEIAQKTVTQNPTAWYSDMKKALSNLNSIKG